MNRPVCILREEIENDEYRILLESNGFQVHFYKLLDTNYLCSNEQLDRLNNMKNYSGLILTSQKSVKAIKLMNIDLKSNLITYVVGPATFKSASDLGLSPIGQDSGSALSLAKYIITNHKSDLPLLFCTGDKTRVEMTEILGCANINYEVIKVYETFQVKLDRTISNSIIVLFSPSGLDSVDLGRFCDCKWVSIGSSTRDRLLQDGIGSITAGRPSPTGVLEAIFSLEI